MTQWIALLRGVNVGGITIRSADLAAVFSALGFEDVTTVLASGNVRFTSDAARTALKRDIEAALRARFDYDAWILLRTADELRAAIEGYPFDETDAARQPWVVFCVDETTRAELLAAASALDTARDPVAGGDGAVYWSPLKGSTTDTPFAKLLAKTAYKPRTTTRNLRTLRRIVG